MTTRAFFLVPLVTLLLSTACGSNHGNGQAGGSTTTGSGGASGGDCTTVCESIAGTCGQDPAQCGPVCAKDPSPAVLQCLQAAGCDLVTAGNCLKSSSSSSSSTSSTSSSSSSSSGSTCVDNNQSGCTKNKDCCDMVDNAPVECTQGTCCMPSGYVCKLASDQCCTGLTCTDVGGTDGLCM